MAPAYACESSKTARLRRPPQPNTPTERVHLINFRALRRAPHAWTDVSLILVFSSSHHSRSNPQKQDYCTRNAKVKELQPVQLDAPPLGAGQRCCPTPCTVNSSPELDHPGNDASELYPQYTPMAPTALSLSLSVLPSLSLR